MLFEILKALGLDIPAKVDELRANLDQRVERATAQVSRAAQQAAVLAALYTLAAVAALVAVGVGLVALYLRVAEAYGVYAGLGVVFAILLVVAATLGTVGLVRSRSLGRNLAEAPRPVLGGSWAGSEAGAVSRPPAVAPSTAAAPEAPRPSASDIVEPLAVFLAKSLTYSGAGKPMVDELIGNLSATAPGVVDKALERAANVIRNGDRANVLMVLGGAAFAGWLLARHSRQK
jgi:hypothetical protein